MHVRFNGKAHAFTRYHSGRQRQKHSAQRGCHKQAAYHSLTVKGADLKLGRRRRRAVHAELAVDHEQGVGHDLLGLVQRLSVGGLVVLPRHSVCEADAEIEHLQGYCLV